MAERGQKVRVDPEGNKTVTTFADSDELLKTVLKLDWNSYRLLANGPHISLWINDVLMCEVEDHQPQLRACVAVSSPCRCTKDHR